MNFGWGAHICRTVGCSWLITSSPHIHSGSHLDFWTFCAFCLPQQPGEKGDEQRNGYKDEPELQVKPVDGTLSIPGQCPGGCKCCWVTPSRHQKVDSSPGLLPIALDVSRTCLTFMVQTLMRKCLNWLYPTAQFCSFLPVHSFSW